MGESFFSIDEGSARKIRTWQRSVSSNDVEEQVVVVSEPFLPTYRVAVTTEISTAVADSHLLQIMGSSINRLYLRRLQVYQSTGATTSTLALWALRRLSTAGTGGTSFTPNPNDPADTATTATSMTLPSAKGTEGVALDSGTMQLLTAASTILAGAMPLILDLDYTKDRTKSPIIAAGLSNGIALKLLTAVAAGKVLITAEFAEAFWS